MTFASGAGTANEWQVLFNLGSYSNTAVYFDKFTENQWEECFFLDDFAKKEKLNCIFVLFCEILLDQKSIVCVRE